MSVNIACRSDRRGIARAVASAGIVTLSAAFLCAGCIGDPSPFEQGTKIAKTKGVSVSRIAGSNGEVVVLKCSSARSRVSIQARPPKSACTHNEKNIDGGRRSGAHWGKGGEIQMLSISLPALVEQRLAELAKSRGVSEGDLARELIQMSLDDIDDIEMVIPRIENRQPPLTSEQARKALGLDD